MVALVSPRAKFPVEVYLSTNDYNTAHELSNRIGKYTIATTRTSSSNRYGKVDFNLSSDTSLTGRDYIILI